MSKGILVPGRCLTMLGGRLHVEKADDGGDAFFEITIVGTDNTAKRAQIDLPEMETFARAILAQIGVSV